MRQAKTVKQSPDRRAVDGERALLAQGNHQFIQRHLALPRDTSADPVGDPAQLAAPGIALPLRRETPGFAFELHHVVDELYRNPEMRRRPAMAVAFFHKRDDPFPHLNWMWLAHLRPPYLHRRQGITVHRSKESRTRIDATRSNTS